MGRRLSLVVCSVLLAANWTFALPQGSKTPTDPITGTWTGEFVLRNDASNRVAITMELKFDGRSAVSGTFTGLPSPGDVKKGTFDPKNGTLRLELGKQGEAPILLVLEGAVADGTATGHFTGEETGDFRLSRKARQQ